MKRFIGKVTGHNDHYMINMGGQRPKIGGNWPLIVYTLYMIILTKNIVARCVKFYYKRPNDWLTIFM